jgi:hypothetical protein
MVDGGDPTGVNEPAEDGGGGPAGVVDGPLGCVEKALPPRAFAPRLVSGVDGGLEAKGTEKAMMNSFQEAQGLFLGEIMS